MEDLGCHFKFEKLNGKQYHDTNLLLSSGRNCLRYIVRERHISTIYLPYFLCESLSEVSVREGIKIKYYHVDSEYLPVDSDIDEFDENTYLYLVNYFGLLSKKIEELTNKYKRVIVDNTHDFFRRVDTPSDVIYNYRKYFGVPDGACIVSKDLQVNPNYPIGKSLGKIIEMVSRDETGEFFHYPSFLEADKFFRDEDLVYMSNFTRNFISVINYDEVLARRIRNFKHLRDRLSKYNRMDLTEKDLTYLFPLLVSDGEDLREYLGKNGIYALKLWPNVSWNGANCEEIKRVEDTVLLPIDQRYQDGEMEFISDTIDKYYSLIKKPNS